MTDTYHRRPYRMSVAPPQPHRRFPLFVNAKTYCYATEDNRERAKERWIKRGYATLVADSPEED